MNNHNSYKLSIIMRFRFVVLLLISISVIFSSCKKQELAKPTQSIDIFNVFWEDFNRTYPYFIHKQIDWDSLHTVFASQINQNTTSEELFKLIGELSLKLKDIHVYLSSSYGDYHYSKNTFTRKTHLCMQQIT